MCKGVCLCIYACWGRKAVQCKLCRVDYLQRSRYPCFFFRNSLFYFYFTKLLWGSNKLDDMKANNTYSLTVFNRRLIRERKTKNLDLGSGTSLREAVSSSSMPLSVHVNIALLPAQFLMWAITSRSLLKSYQTAPVCRTLSSFSTSWHSRGLRW